MIMRKLLFSLLLLPVTVLAGVTEDSLYTLEHYRKEEVYIPMRDGIKLFTAIYSPKNANGKSPILITRTPYSVSPYGAAFRNFWRNHWMHYIRNGYILVLQDVRGRYMSEGEFVDVRPVNTKPKAKEIDETTDSHDTFDWLLKNVKGNNGRVGITGSSYPGFYAAMGAMSGHPALKASIPQAPVTDWFMGDDFHHNGAFFLLDAFQFYSSFGQPRPTPTTQHAKGFQFKGQDNYDFFLKAGSLSNILPLLGDASGFWKDLFNHPNYDEFWQARNSRNHVNRIKPHTATLVVGGSYDAEDVFGAYRLSESIQKTGKKNHTLCIGPWSHGQWYRDSIGNRLGNVWFEEATCKFYQDSIEIPFLDHHLLGKTLPNSWKAANVFLSGINQWYRAPTWPPVNANSSNLFLTASEKLSLNPDATSTSSVYRSDPTKPVPYTEDVHLARTREYMTDDQRFASRRPDVLVYRTAPLDSMLCITGPVQASLNLSLTTSDADVVVKIIDEYPEHYRHPEAAIKAGVKYPMGGYQQLVRGEVMRSRFRNSFSKPEPIVPNQPTLVSYTLPDVAHCWMPGHKLMVQIQSTWFPLVDRNPQQFVNPYQCKDEDFIPTEVRIHQSEKWPSKISFFQFSPSFK